MRISEKKVDCSKSRTGGGAHKNELSRFTGSVKQFGEVQMSRGKKYKSKRWTGETGKLKGNFEGFREI